MLPTCARILVMETRSFLGINHSSCICGCPSRFQSSGIVVSSVYSRERNQEYSLLECTDCGVLRTDPFPKAEELQKIYENDYAYSFHDAVAVEKGSRARSLLKYLVREAGTSDIIEFGSGAGILLNEATKLGMGVLGIELSKNAGNALPFFLKNKLIHSSAENFLEECEAISSTVVLSHTLEHFLKPDEVLQRIFLKMNYGESLVIVVPNRKNCLGKNRNKFWGYWQVPVHTYHFDRESLEALVKSVGFIPIKVSYRSGDFLSKGLFVSNLLKLKGSSIPNRNIFKLISFFSRIWSRFYRLGRSDLILISRKQ